MPLLGLCERFWSIAISLNKSSVKLSKPLKPGVLALCICIRNMNEYIEQFIPCYTQKNNDLGEYLTVFLGI